MARLLGPGVVRERHRDWGAADDVLCRPGRAPARAVDALVPGVSPAGPEQRRISEPVRHRLRQARGARRPPQGEGDVLRHLRGRLVARPPHPAARAGQGDCLRRLRLRQPPVARHGGRGPGLTCRFPSRIPSCCASRRASLEGAFEILGVLGSFEVIPSTSKRESPRPHRQGTARPVVNRLDHVATPGLQFAPSTSGRISPQSDELNYSHRE